MKLLPKSAHAYDEYWQSIRLYNIWFVKLRWFAAAALLVYWFAIEYIFGFKLLPVQSLIMISNSFLILAYNYLFYKSLKNNNKSNKNQLEFSLFQILMDLLCLSFVVYVSGGLEAPIFMFYVFHMIIGSLILPAFVMYSIAGTLIVVFSLLSILELYGVIPHYTISGLLPFNFYDNLIYVIGVLSIFSSVVIITVMLTSKISSELYGREKHLKKALDELNEAEKSKQKYVIAIVHELKSPIVASMSQMELVLGNFVGEINENVRAKIQIAKERALGAIEMINNILHVSKFKLFNNLKMEEVLLTPIILSRINVLANIAERNRISVKFENAENENVKINADNVLLELVFSNLIGNAVKYTQENGNVIITMKDEGNFRVVEIIDNGIGIPQNEQHKIFDDYYRASNSSTKEGAGIGLSVVKQIIENHNGKIELKSPSRIGDNKRPGAEFKLFLPLK